MRRAVFSSIVVAAMLPAAAAAQDSPRDSVRADSTPPIVLPPVTVTVTRTERELERVPYAVSVVDRDEVQLGRLTDGLDEALAAFAGVVVSNRYNYSLDQRLSVRGFGARSAFGVRGIKVLLDGVPQTLPDGQGQLTNIELADVGRIEILRSSSSTLYGNASGGVVSIWTDQPPIARLAPTARVTAGAYGFRKWLAGAAVPLGRGRVSVNTSRTTTDGFRAHSSADTRRADVRLLQAVGSRTTLTVAAFVADQPTLDNPGALTRAEADTSPSAADPRNVTANAGKAVTQAQAAVVVDHRFAGDATLSATLFALRRDLENPLAFAYIALDRWAYGTRATTTIPVEQGRARHVVTLGFDAQWQRDDRENFTTDRSALQLSQFERVFELGPFGQIVLEVTPRMDLTLGVRYDRVGFRADDRFLSDGSDDSGERVMSALSGTTGLSYELTPAVRPYASVGTSFETPTTTELANRPDGAGGFNPELDPQRAVNYELGLRGRLGDRVTYSAAGFYSDVRDLLVPFEVPGAPSRRFFRNVGLARHSGAELELRVRPLAGVQLVAAYTYADHRFRRYQTAADTLDGNEIPGVPRHYAHVSLRYRSPAGLWAALDNTWSGGYYVDDNNMARNDAWAMTALRVGWQGVIARWRLAPFLGVQNVFDSRYVGSVVVNARGGRYYEPAPPRNLYVGLSIGAAP